jgi:hypothetical protein
MGGGDQSQENANMTDCDSECREYVSRLLSPTEVAKRLGVSMRHVNQLARTINVGIMVAGGRLYPPEDVRQLERHQATKRHGPGKGPQARAREIEREMKPRTEITMSQTYQDAIRRLRGETP